MSKDLEKKGPEPPPQGAIARMLNSFLRSILRLDLPEPPQENPRDELQPDRNASLIERESRKLFAELEKLLMLMDERISLNYDLSAYHASGKGWVVAPGRTGYLIVRPRLSRGGEVFLDGGVV